MSILAIILKNAWIRYRLAPGVGARKGPVMAWEKDDKGNFVAGEDGNPIWVEDNGDKVSANYGAKCKDLREANAESRKRKEKLREYEEKYALFKDIEDLTAWKAEADKAIETLKAMPDKDKELEAQIAEKIAAATGNLKAQMAEKDKKLVEKDKAISEQTNRLNALLIKANVQSSKVLNERIKPEDKPFIARELERAGRVDNEGKVYFSYDDGTTILAGDDAHNATADEAVTLIMEKLGIDPKTKLLSQNNQSGSGGNPLQPGGFNEKQINPWGKETWNVTEQNRIMVKDPVLAQRLRQAAGR